MQDAHILAAVQLLGEYDSDHDGYLGPDDVRQMLTDLYHGKTSN